MALRIAYVVHRFPALHNTYLVNEIAALVGLGVDVRILSLSSDCEPIVNESIAGLMDRVTFVDDLEARGVPTVVRDAGTEGISEGMAWRIGSTTDLFRDERIDIVHGAFGNRPGTFAMLLALTVPSPFTFTTHALDLYADFGRSREKLARAAFVTTVCEANRRYLIDQRGADPERVHVVHIGPDFGLIDTLPPDQRLPGSIVSCCRLHPIKGLHVALDAVRRVRETQPGLSYTLIGDGELEDELRRLAKTLNLEDCVTFRGAVTNREACREMQRASVFLLPSMIAEDGDRDATPTAMLEAMALGLPVVASSVGGIPELVDDGVTGLLTEPGDAQSVADALAELLANPERSQAMGKRGRSKARLEFDASSSARALVELWQGVL